jgi:hypothetical protein
LASAAPTAFAEAPTLILFWDTTFSGTGCTSAAGTTTDAAAGTEAAAEAGAVPALATAVAPAVSTTAPAAAAAKIFWDFFTVVLLNWA